MKSRDLGGRPVIIQTNGYKALASNMRQYVLKRTESAIKPQDNEEVKKVKDFCNADKLEQGMFCATSRTSSVCNGDQGGKFYYEFPNMKLISLHLSRPSSI